MGLRLFRRELRRLAIVVINARNSGYEERISK